MGWYITSHSIYLFAFFPGTLCWRIHGVIHLATSDKSKDQNEDTKRATVNHDNNILLMLIISYSSDWIRNTREENYFSHCLQVHLVVPFLWTCLLIILVFLARRRIMNTVNHRLQESLYQKTRKEMCPAFQVNKCNTKLRQSHLRFLHVLTSLSPLIFQSDTNNLWIHRVFLKKLP